MLPVLLDDQPDTVPIFLLGVRETPADEFQYLRIPADPEGTKQTFLLTRQALQDEALRQEAVSRYVRQAIPAHRSDMASQLSASAQRAVALFAGAEPQPGAPGVNGKAAAGLHTKVVAVTVLTSLDDHDLNRVGVPDSPELQVARLAALAQEAESGSAAAAREQPRAAATAETAAAADESDTAQKRTSVRAARAGR
jgi:hypothetical protein